MSIGAHLLAFTTIVGSPYTGPGCSLCFWHDCLRSDSCDSCDTAIIFGAFSAFGIFLKQKLYLGVRTWGVFFKNK